jgi:hypothetical protein
MTAVRSFTNLMVLSEISLLRSLHGKLSAEGIQSRDEFADLMKAAFEYGNLEARRLADDLGYSFSTVYRWIDGRSAPHPSLWPRIADWVGEAMATRIAEHEANETEMA